MCLQWELPIRHVSNHVSVDWSHVPTTVCSLPTVDPTFDKLFTQLISIEKLVRFEQAKNYLNVAKTLEYSSNAASLVNFWKLAERLIAMSCAEPIMIMLFVMVWDTLTFNAVNAVLLHRIICKSGTIFVYNEWHWRWKRKALQIPINLFFNTRIRGLNS